MGRELRELAPAGVQRAWQRWLRDYWSDRLTGLPRPLAEGERHAMAGWVIGLEAVVSEAMSFVEGMHVPLGEHRLLFLELERSGFATRQPAEAARFVLHVLKGATELTWGCELVDKLMRALITARVDRQLLVGICEEMARFGCPSASTLRDLVGKDGPDP
jgi:hypothetical protein